MDIERGDIVRLSEETPGRVRECVVVGVIEWYRSYPGEPSRVAVRVTEEADGYGAMAPSVDLELEEFEEGFEERLGRLDFERGERWLSPRRRESYEAYAEALEEKEEGKSEE